jgi:hypothetical protein
MAFHPFGTFRKHKKVIFAALTIICMFSFVLCSGVGKWDPVQQIAAWFGGRSQRQTIVTKINGQKIDETELNNLRRQRDMADKIITQITQQAYLKVRLKMDESNKDNKPLFDRLEPSTAITLNLLLRSEQDRFANDRNPQVMRLLGRELTEEQRKQRVLVDFRMAESERNRLIGKNKQEDADLLGQYMTVLQFEMWMRDRPGQETLFFGGSLRLDDLLDFMMWRKYADKLGIELTEADIRAEINREGLGEVTIEEDRTKADERVQKMLRDWPTPVTISDVYKAIGDELRVYMAQTALIGYAAGARHYRYILSDINRVPALATPAEFWKFYQDNRTTLRVALLPVKVESILEKVPKTPDDEKELKDLFMRFKDAEPHPDSKDPGFKLPRRLQVEWVSATGVSPHYQKLARERFALKEMLLPSLAVTPGHLFTALTPRPHLVYDYTRKQPIDYVMPKLNVPEFSLSYYRDMQTPANVAALFGQLAAAGTTGGTLMAPFGSYQANAYVRHKDEFGPLIERERKRRAGFYASLFLAQGGYPTANPLTGVILSIYATEQQQFLPLEAVKDDVLRQINDNLALDSAVGDLDTIIKELDKRKSRPADARKYLDDKLKEQAFRLWFSGTSPALKHGRTREPLDRYSLGQDEALKPLKDAYLLDEGRKDPDQKQFVEMFFNLAGVYVPGKVPKETIFGTGWKTATEPYLFWTTEDKPAKVQSYEDAYKQVVSAWRQQRARNLARAEAERILKAVRELKANGDGLKFLNDEAAKHKEWGLVEDLNNIARLVRVPNAGIGASDYAPYKDADKKINPPADFVDMLMKALKETGDATIVWNKPASVYYVALLTSIARPTLGEFRTIYQPPSLASGSTLWQIYDNERRRDHRKAILKQMRNEAGGENGKWVVPDEIRKRFEGRDSEE